MSKSIARPVDLIGRIIEVLRSILVILTLVFGAWLAYKQMFMGFAAYDDEGGMLLYLLGYLKHPAGLYTTVFAQYGPFYFYAQQFMHAILHLPVNHDGSRLLSLVYWTLSSFLSMCFVYKLTQSRLLAAACYLFTLAIATVLRNEPGHPQEIILLLIEIAVLLSLFILGKRSAYALVGIGMIAAFLCLTKINIGIFFIATITMTWVALLRGTAVNRGLFAGASLVASVLPVALMRNFLGSSHPLTHSWTLHFCVLATISIASVCIAAGSRGNAASIHISTLIYVFAGLLVGTLATFALAFVQGISSPALLEGIILGPLRHPSVFYVPISITGRHLRIGFLLAVGVSCLHIFKRRFVRHQALIARSKIAAGVVCLRLLLTNSFQDIWILFPLSALLLWQPRQDDRLEWKLPRLFLCFLMVFEFLQAFPVAGSQVGIALTPGAAWCCLVIYDGIAALAPEGHTVRLFPGMRPQAGLLALQVLLLIAIWRSPLNIWMRGPTLDLPGATHIHLTAEQAELYRTMAYAIHANCDVLFTMPGMGSWNLFSEVPTPNGHNLTAWVTGFTDAEQEQIADILRHSARPCVVYDAPLLKGWLPGGTAPLATSPLANYVYNETHPVLTLSDYELRIPIAQH